MLAPPAQTSVAGRPVANLSLAVNYAINAALGVDQRGDPNGPNKTIGYHVFNMLSHLACGLLLFGVIRRTVARLSGEAAASERLAGLAVLLWLAHPIQTEAVDYVVQRTEILVSIFYVGTLYAAIRAWDEGAARRRRRWYVAGVIACALGMASKEVMVTAPLVVALYDRFVRGTPWRSMSRDGERRLFYGGLAATLLLVVASIASHARSQSVGFGLGVSWYRYLDTQAWAIARYSRLLAWPSGLTFDYGERPIGFARSIPGLVLMVACLAVTTWALVRRRWAPVGFAGLWFFLLLAPSSSVIPIKTEIAAERRIYLASAAVFVLAIVGLERLLRRTRNALAVERALAAAACVACVATSFVRGLTYRNQETLYRDVIAKAPDNPRGYVGVGLAYLLRGPESFDDAERYFRQATAVDSTSTVAWRSLALLEVLEGRFAQSVDAYAHVLRVDSTDANANDGMAHALLQLHRANDAVPYVERLGTADIDLLWALGHELVDEREGTVAVRYLEAAASREPPAATNLAILSEAYAQSGRTDDARSAAAVATASAGDTAAVYVDAGEAMLTAHRPDDARVYLERALAIDPSLAPARHALDSLRAALR